MNDQYSKGLRKYLCRMSLDAVRRSQAENLTWNNGRLAAEVSEDETQSAHRRDRQAELDTLVQPWPSGAVCIHTDFGKTIAVSFVSLPVLASLRFGRLG